VVHGYDAPSALLPDADEFRANNRRFFPNQRRKIRSSKRLTGNTIRS
jgi:hypothetical protein